MFPSRYYPARMFAARYYPKVGASVSAVGRIRATFTSRRPAATFASRRPAASFASRRPTALFTVEED